MLLRHPQHPGRAVRLAYCLNLHPADTLDGLLEGLRTITLPLRQRIAPGAEFGVGMYAPARLAAGLLEDGWSALKAFLDEHGLDAFTWNAFPHGGFGEAGLKQRVFEPTWADERRVAFTRDVARLARSLVAWDDPTRHVSISTHSGWHSSRAPRAVHTPRAYLRGCLEAIGDAHGQVGPRLVLGLEAEPRSNCNDSAELAAWRRELCPRSPAGTRPVLGTCLDACHAAVEFEVPAESLVCATAGETPLAKLQFTSALALHASRREHLEPLLRLDEPRYLHQVTARTPDGFRRVGDLPDLAQALDEPGGEVWWDDAELRCHFHVPVDLAALGAGGLSTTRDHADATLAAALARPERWGTDELHVEIETYTWDVLPREARGSGELVEGLEREYAHVLGRLEDAGWQRA